MWVPWECKQNLNLSLILMLLVLNHYIKIEIVTGIVSLPLALPF